MRLSVFNYDLPRELIAQEPAVRRDASRLLILTRKDKRLQETIFKNIINFIHKGDLLILNDTRVLKARLVAERRTGGHIEVLLLKQRQPDTWEVLVRPGKKAPLGEKIFFAGGAFSAEVLEKTAAGGRLIKFNSPDIKGLIDRYGQMPLPHYIKKELKSPDNYQTVYAKKEGAVAAPTAGLHFTRQLLRQLKSHGVEIAYITLHCGLATFRPVKTQDVRRHQMEAEFYQIDSYAADRINKARSSGGRVIAVGTTVARALEAAAVKNKQDSYDMQAQAGETSIYIYPGYKFKVIDALLTNFHLPHSTNLIMVSAFAGIRLVRRAYEYAIKKRFRFYSFGDAMLVI